MLQTNLTSLPMARPSGSTPTTLPDPAVFLLKRLKKHHPTVYLYSLRTADFALKIAGRLGLSDREAQILHRSAMLQDIGMLHIRQQTTDDLLKHTIYGAAVVQPLDEQGLVDGQAILHHHENVDGTGFPYGLGWKELSLNAKILRAAGAFSAQLPLPGASSAAVFGRRLHEALEELYRWSDMMYDGEIVALLHETVKEELKGVENGREGLFLKTE